MAKKDAMGQEVDSLYLSLGLNAADLEMGFQTAGQTVRQAMSRLNSEANQIRLKADIDVTRLEAAGKSVEALKAREKALNDELAVQQKKLELLNRAYQANAKTYGADYSLTRGVDTKRLYQTRDIERLKAQIALVNAELGKTGSASTSGFGKLSAGAEAAKGKVTGAVSSIKAMNAAIVGLVAGVSAGAGLFSVTDKAMNAGNNLYLLSTRLHTTVGEASKLSKMFQISGVDINAAIPLILKLDKRLEAAGDKGNDLTNALQEFGIELTDGSGHILSYTKQLEALARGYQKAIELGKTESFEANILGPRGAALVPLLQEYPAIQEITNRLKGNGLLNVEEARKAYIEWQVMQMQASQLTGAIGQAMLPVARELMPEITQGFAEFAQLIKDNQEGIKEFGSAAGTAIGGLSSAIVSLISVLGDLKKGFSDVSGAAKDIDLLKENGMEEYLSRGKTAGAILGGMVGGSAAGPAGAIGGAAIGANVGEAIYGKLGAFLTPEAELEAARQRKALREQEKKSIEEFSQQMAEARKENSQGAGLEQEKRATDIRINLEQQLAKATSTRLKEQLQAIKEKVEASIAEGNDEAAAWTKVEKDIAKAAQDAMKEAKAANEELEKSIYSLTHSDFQNNIHGVDMAAKAMLGRGADSELVAQEAALKKQKVIEQFESETASYLDGIYADSLTQRLNQIEREKKAWIQKGLDEVTATRAAEAQKKQATNDSIKSMFTSQKKYLDIYRRAMRGQVDNGMGAMLYDFTNDPATRQQNAVKMIQREIMKEAGVDPSERTNLAEVRGFQQAMKGANDWGLSLLGQGGADLSEVTSAVSESGAQMTGILEQINGSVPEINSNLSQILGAIQSREQGNQINVNPTINVDLGGAYVFDNALKKQLTDDITKEVADGVTSAVQEATSRINTGFAG